MHCSWCRHDSLAICQCVNVVWYRNSVNDRRTHTSLIVRACHKIDYVTVIDCLLEHCLPVYSHFLTAQTLHLAGQLVAYLHGQVLSWEAGCIWEAAYILCPMHGCRVACHAGVVSSKQSPESNSGPAALKVACSPHQSRDFAASSAAQLLPQLITIFIISNGNDKNMYSQG